MNLRNDRSLWLGVAAVFALMFGAWTILFTLVAKHRVPEVPLVTHVEKR